MPGNSCSNCGYEMSPGLGICTKCGTPAAPSASQQSDVVNVAAPSGSSPVEISCIEWMDALGQELAEAESQMKAHFKDQQYHYWEGVCNGIETAIDALQRLQSASIEKLNHI